MPYVSRFIESLPDSVGLKSAYGGEHEVSRMKAVRPNIQKVRQAWKTDKGYRSLIENIRTYLRPAALPKEAREPFLRLLEGYRDYGDMDYGRPVKPPVERFDALELYTSDAGFTSLYRLMGVVMRHEQPDEEALEVATAMVELLTIDLYNLRLSQIGHPRYANFEGVTHRGLTITHGEFDEYKAILAREDLSKRNFSVPLGLVSSSTDKSVMEDFSKNPQTDSEKIKLHLTIHIRGVDPALLEEYFARYPDSVVTSICAMPVAHVSSYGEKEVLLRGPFFHLIAVESGSTANGQPYHRLVVVMMNANRDHGLEHASDEGEKERQRQCFLRTVSASKYETCAAVAEKHAPGDAEGYRQLQHLALKELREINGMNFQPDGRMANAKARDVATWLGGALVESYPFHYADRRVKWQNAIRCENWVAAEEVLQKEYDWKKGDWYNVGKLTDHGEELINDNLTFLHILAIKPSPSKENVEQHAAYERLLEGAIQPEVWKTVKSFDSAQKTAYDLALEHGNEFLISNLQPRPIHRVDAEALADVEAQFHEIMRECVGQFLDTHIFHLPQLSVLTEMQVPELWIPIPLMYGGFFITLHLSSKEAEEKEEKEERGRDIELKVKLYETVIGQVRQREREFVLRCR